MKKILIVDDNAAGRVLLQVALKAAGRQILTAPDGRQALEIIRSEVPDLILLDLEMPVLDGLGVLREIRQDPRFVALPVVAVSANALHGARERALAAGFDDYITKPISAAAVRQQVATLLSGDAETPVSWRWGK